MTFIAWVIAAIVCLLLVAFVFCLLFAWWDRSMARKCEAKRLREYVAARELRRYHHRPEHACGLIGDTNLVHIDARCVAWTIKLKRTAAEFRRARVRAALRRLAELRQLAEMKKARELPRASNRHSLN